MGKVGKIVTSVVAGIALTGAVAAVGIFALNDAGATSISESTVRSYQGKYYSKFSINAIFCTLNFYYFNIFKNF